MSERVLFELMKAWKDGAEIDDNDLNDWIDAYAPTLPEPSEMDGARWGYTADDMEAHATDAYNAGWKAGCKALLRAILAAELANPEPEPVFWIGSNGGAMPDEIYQDWSKEYPEDSKYFSPLYRKDDV